MTLHSALDERAFIEAATALTTIEPPSGAWAVIRARIAAADAVVLPAFAEPATAAPGDAPFAMPSLPRRDATSRRAIIAAAALLVVAGAAAAMVTTDAGRALLNRLRGADVVQDAVPAVTSPAETSTVPTEMVMTGGRDLEVDIQSAGPGLSLRIRLGTEADAVIRATGGAAAARFQSGTRRLVIANAANGEITLVLPASRYTTRVLVDGRPWIERRAGSLRILAAVADTIGTDVILMVPVTSQNTPKEVH